MNETTDNTSPVNYEDILPCSCQRCHGAKASKISTLTKNVRNHAAPYIINTAEGSTDATPCVHCKLKEEEEQHKQLHMQQYNCSCISQQPTTHCHCHRNPSMTTPHLTVPPPPLPPVAPSLLPAMSETPLTNLFTSMPISSMTAASNQMYFIPFGVPSVPVMPAPTPIMPYTPLPYVNRKPRRTAPPLPAMPPLSAKPKPPLPPQKAETAKTPSGEENNSEEPLEAPSASEATEESTETNDNSNHENGEQEAIMSSDDYHDELNPNNEVIHKTAKTKKRPAEWQWSCDLCKEDHALRLCSQFLKSSVYERFEFVKQNHYCLNCLARSHHLRDCKSEEGCFDCTERHNSLLHGAPQLNDINYEDLIVNIDIPKPRDTLATTKETISPIIPGRT